MAFEEQLRSSVELMDETGDLARIVLDILAGASVAGVALPAVVPLQFAAWKLDPAGGVPAYSPGGPLARPTDGGFGSDQELLEATWDAEEQVRVRLRSVLRLDAEIDDAVEEAETDQEVARQDVAEGHEALSQAMAMPLWVPCRGCHPAKKAATADADELIADAERRARDADRRLRLLEEAGDELVDPLASRLREAAQALRQVPRELGEEYEVVYAYLERGGRLPKAARFITGAGVLRSGAARA